MMNQELFENWLRCHCSVYVSLGKPKEESGLVYIPLLSPAPKRNQKLPLMPSFSLEEIESFHSRYQEETNDCSTESDKRYRLWMKMYHPHLEASEDGPSSFIFLPLIVLPHPSSSVYHQCVLKVFCTGKHTTACLWHKGRQVSWRRRTL